MIWNNFVVVGDSISVGVRSKRNWITEYSLLLMHRHGIVPRPFTFLKSGWTSGDILKGLGDFIKNRENELFLQLGTNDLRANVRPQDFADNMRLIASMFLPKRTYIIKVPVPNGFGSNGYTTFNKNNVKLQVELYNEALKNEFYNSEVSFIESEGLSLADGIHLSDKGNEELAERVLQEVERVRLWK